MLDRGLRAALRPAGRARGARRPPSGRRAATRPAARPARPADVHDRPADRARLRRRDLRRARCGDGAMRVWVHIADVVALRAARARRSTARRTGAAPASTCPARSSRCCPRRCRTAPARSCPGEDRLAVTVELEFEGAKVRRTRVPPLADPLRRAARLRRASTASSPARSAPRRRGRSRWRPRARSPRRCRRARERARRAGGRVRRAGVRLLARGPRRPRSRATRADRVAPADRAPDDRRQRGGRDAARDAQACRRSTASTSAPSRARVERLRRRSSRRSTCRRRRCPSTMTPQQAGDAGRRDLAAASTQHVRRTRPRPRGAHLARAALAQAGALLAAQPRPRRPALAALLPLHLADPPLPRPRLPPRAAVGGRRRARTRRAPSSLEAAGDVVLGARARRDDDRARRRRRRALLPARARAVRARLARRVRGRGRSGVIGAGAFVAFGDGYEGMLPVRRLRGDWWELNEEGTMLVGARDRRGAPARRPGARAGRARRRAARARRPAARRASSELMAKGEAQDRRRATSPPTGRRRYRYDLLDGSRPASCSRAPRSSRCATARRSSRTATPRVRDGEVWLHNVHIPPYAPAARENHEPERPRKLLLHRREIERLIGKTQRAGADARPDAHLLHGPAREGRDRARARQGRRRQARVDQGARDEARDGARAARRAR